MDHWGSIGVRRQRPHRWVICALPAPAPRSLVSSVGHRSTLIPLLPRLSAAGLASTLWPGWAGSALAQSTDETAGELGALWPLLDGAMDRPAIGMLAMVAALALVATGLGAVLIGLKARKRRTEARLRGELANMRAMLDRMEGLIAAQRGISIVWDDRGVEVLGALRGIDKAPRPGPGLLDFKSWLDPVSASTLEVAAQALRTRGETFSILVATLAGERLAADGLTAGGSAVLTLRAVSSIEREKAALTDRCAELERHNEAAQALFEALNTPVWINDADDRVAWANQAYAKAVGAETAEEAVRERNELLDRAARDKLREGLGKEQRFSGVLRPVAGGARRAYEVTAVSFVQGSVALARDIQEVEQVHAELARQAGLHERTLNRVGTAIATFSPDRRLSSFNEAFAELWGLDHEWLRTGPGDGAILDALREAGKLPEQADYRAWKQAYLDSYASREEPEDWWHLPDGRTLKVIVEPHPAGGVTCLYENVTEQLALESRHKASMEIQRETLDHLKEGVAQFSSDGLLRLYNPAFAEMWKLGDEQLAGRPHVRKVISWARVLMDEPALWDRIKACVTGLEDTRQPVSLRMTRPDGIVLDCIAMPLPGGGTLVTFADVTATAAAEQALVERNEALEKADKVKNTFVQHVSYVLRAPLTTVIGYAQLLAQKSTGKLNDHQHEITEHILTASHSLLAIVNDILDLASIDADAMDLHLRKVEPHAVMLAAAAGLQDRVSEANLTLDIADPGDIGSFVADETRIKQVLFNLLANAITNSPPGATVGLTCTASDTHVTFAVADTGSGIPKEILDRAFDRFEGAASHNGERGAGLGLSLVKSLVDLHGGAVHLDTADGKGTRVTCSFPREAKRPKRTEPAARDAIRAIEGAMDRTAER